MVISSQELSPREDSWTHVRTSLQAVELLKTRDIANIVVGAGRQIGLAFLKDGLIDEIVLDVQPVVFRTGTHLLGE